MSDFKAEFRPSTEHPDHWEVWHSRDDGATWTFDRLEQKRTEPSDEQLADLATALGLPTLPPSLRPAHWREAMLNLHALVQNAVDGDEQAAFRLSHLRAMFSRNEAA